jgi:hypothetical protein
LGAVVKLPEQGGAQLFLEIAHIQHEQPQHDRRRDEAEDRTSGPDSVFSLCHEVRRGDGALSYRQDKDDRQAGFRGW